MQLQIIVLSYVTNLRFAKNVSQEDYKCIRNLSMLVFYHLGFNPKIYLGVIALINFHLGCSTPSHVLGRCPLFNLGLHQNVIVGFVLWAYYTSPPQLPEPGHTCCQFLDKSDPRQNLVLF